MPLPRTFVKRGLKIAAGGMRLYGIEVQQLTQEELLAAVAVGWFELDRLQKEALANQSLVKPDPARPNGEGQ